MDFKKWFLDPVQNHYADFEGRATRQQFWMYVLVVLMISVVFMILGAVIGSVAGMVHMLISLGLLVPGLAIGARRLHDTGKSGWLQLIVLIPFLGVIVLIVLMALEGDAGPNKYGTPVGGAVASPVSNQGTPAAPVPPASEPGTTDTQQT